MLPEIIAALTFDASVKAYPGGNLVCAAMAGGAPMLLAGALAQWVDKKSVPA